MILNKQQAAKKFLWL